MVRVLVRRDAECAVLSRALAAAQAVRKLAELGTLPPEDGARTPP